MIQTMNRSNTNPFMGKKSSSEPNPKRKEPEIINIDDDEDYTPRPIKQQRTVLPVKEDKIIKRALTDSLKEESAKRRKLLEAQDNEFNGRKNKEKGTIEKLRQKEAQEKATRSKLLTDAYRALPPEPSDDVNAIDLILRFPDGSRIRRKFYLSQDMQHLKLFIDYHLLQLGYTFSDFKYQIIQDFPRIAYSDFSKTLAEVGFSPRALLTIHP